MTHIEQVLYFSIIILACGIIQSGAGFGFALLAVPLLSSVYPLATIVPLVVIHSTIINIVLLINLWKHINLRKIWLLMLFCIAGIPLGVYALKALNANIMSLVIGIILIITVAAMYRGAKVEFKNKSVSYSVVGFISGVLNGGLSMSGPPIVIFLTNEGYDKNGFRANLAANAVITNIITIGAYYFQGMLGTEVLKLSVIGLAALIPGCAAGMLISKKLNNSVFKKAVLILLFTMGIMTVVKAAMQIISG